MSTTYRELRRAVDDVVAAEDGIVEARQKLSVAESNLGRALRACRERKGLSVRAVAKQLKLSTPYLSDVERGRRSITTGNLELLMGIIGPPSIEDMIEAIRKNKISPETSNLKIR